VFALVAYQAQDMGLLPLIIYGVAHGLAIDGKTFIAAGKDLVPALQGPVKVDRIDSDQNITDDVFAGDNVSPLVMPASEPPPGILAEAFGPIGDCPVSTHPTQAGPGGNCQDSGELMPSPLRSTRIGNLRKKGRERLHLLSREHHFGTSSTIR
jgi:hypothetical protein